MNIDFPSFATVKSIIWHFEISLSTTIKADLLVFITQSVWILKSHNISYFLLSCTLQGSCSYPLSVCSNPSSPHSSRSIIFSCIIFVPVFYIHFLCKQRFPLLICIIYKGKSSLIRVGYKEYL